ncbi:TPA: hypothetical protein ACJG01_000829 [Salmonella enterica subsp. salamae serovar 21:z10:[z6]]|nr:hypothetical protein [Salmonella enterica]ECC9703432.1 hypothetical protein [Salmonella enterica subsp. salamae]HCM2001926.1 hypothetical protein [Salmonella enterica subsp. salamae serovar 21:z10:[z6]]
MKHNNKNSKEIRLNKMLYREAIKRINIKMDSGPYAKQNLDKLIESIKSSYEAEEDFHTIFKRNISMYLIINSGGIINLKMMAEIDGMENEIARNAHDKLFNIKLLSWCKTYREMLLLIHSIINEKAFNAKDFIEFNGLGSYVTSFCEDDLNLSMIVDFFDEISFRYGIEMTKKIINTACMKYAKIHSIRPGKIKYSLPFDFKPNECNEKKIEEYKWILDRIPFIDKNAFGEDITELSTIMNKHIPLSLRAYYRYDVYVSCDALAESDIKLFILQTKRAWSQKKYQESVKGKPVLNTHISASAKKQLKLLASVHNKKINEELECIINDAYVRYKGLM